MPKADGPRVLPIVPPKGRKVPEPPSKVRAKLLPAGGSELSPLKKEKALRYIAKYNAQYKARMLNEMRAKVKSPRSGSPRGRPPAVLPL